MSRVTTVEELQAKIESIRKRFTRPYIHDTGGREIAWIFTRPFRESKACNYTRFSDYRAYSKYNER